MRGPREGHRDPRGGAGAGHSTTAGKQGRTDTRLLPASPAESLTGALELRPRDRPLLPATPEVPGHRALRSKARVDPSGPESGRGAAGGVCGQVGKARLTFDDTWSLLSSRLLVPMLLIFKEAEN